jgi:hypothetical protein
MSDNPWLRLADGPCAMLRCKEMFYENGIPLAQRGGSGIYWCHHTHKCLGPDNALVAPEECGPNRSCYEALVQLGQSDPPPV